MKLALFTPGAYIWPMQRSFEGFIASLGAPGQPATDISGSPCYPVCTGNHNADLGMPEPMGDRLQVLHRDLYTALLAPPELFKSSHDSIAERFWPDLVGSNLDTLVNALMYFFTRTSGPGVTVSKGLAVLRGVFFNHEASEPEHWVHSSLERIASERVELPEHSLTFSGQFKPVVDNLAFSIVSGKDRPPSSAGLIQGRLSRGTDGRLNVTVSCGTDPSGTISPAELDSELRQVVSQVFGWPVEVAA